MKHILIVEDEDFLVDAYTIKLKSPLFEVDIARDGEDAVEKINGTIYDLFILDLILPKKNGLEVLSYIRSKPETKKAPVIIATNIDKKETLQEAIKLGATDFFVKSDISIADLLKKIESYLA